RQSRYDFPLTPHCRRPRKPGQMFRPVPQSIYSWTPPLRPEKYKAICPFSSANIRRDFLNRAKSAAAAGRLGWAHGLYFAVLHAISEVNRQTYDQPDDKYFPGKERQLDHKVKGAA